MLEVNKRTSHFFYSSTFKMERKCLISLCMASNVFDTSAFYFYVVNNSESQLSRSSCIGVHTVTSQLHSFTITAADIAGTWGGKDEGMRRPICQVLFSAFSHQEPNSLLSYMTIIAHFSFTAKSHYADLLVHSTSSYC